MARICIITPGQLGSNPRTVKEAEALSRVGHEVIVISTRVLAQVEFRDQAVLVLASFRSLRLPFDRRLGRMLDRLLQILARGLVGSIRSRIVETLAHNPMTRRLALSAMRQPADLYIAHYVAALPAAAYAASRHGSPYAFDAEDFHLGDLPEETRNALEKEIIRKIEGRLLPSAAYVTAASPMIAEAYSDAYAIALPTTVLNVFPRSNAPSGPTSKGSAAPGPSIYWFSQTIGPGRGLETAVEAIARAQSQPHLYLRGMIGQEYEGQLREIAKKNGVADRLHLLDSVAPANLERLGAMFDVGLIAEVDLTKNRQIALTNKLFSYVLGGVPCLATDIPSHSRLAKEFGPAMRLFPVGDADALAAAIDEFLLAPGRLASARAHAWRLGQDRFNWDHEQAKLLCCVDAALGAERRFS